MVSVNRKVFLHFFTFMNPTRLNKQVTGYHDLFKPIYIANRLVNKFLKLIHVTLNHFHLGVIEPVFTVIV